MKAAAQPSLFDKPAASMPLEDALLYALGEFQARGHHLAGRELALDRLHHAFSRSFQKFGVSLLSDDLIVSMLREKGAKVIEISAYFAKRPFRVTVPAALADALLKFSRIHLTLTAVFDTL